MCLPKTHAHLDNQHNVALTQHAKRSLRLQVEDYTLNQNNQLRNRHKHQQPITIILLVINHHLHLLEAVLLAATCPLVAILPTAVIHPMAAIHTQVAIHPMVATLLTGETHLMEAIRLTVAVAITEVLTMVEVPHTVVIHRMVVTLLTVDLPAEAATHMEGLRRTVAHTPIQAALEAVAALSTVF